MAKHEIRRSDSGPAPGQVIVWRIEAWTNTWPSAKPVMTTVTHKLNCSPHNIEAFSPTNIFGLKQKRVITRTVSSEIRRWRSKYWFKCIFQSSHINQSTMKDSCSCNWNWNGMKPNSQYYGWRSRRSGLINVTIAVLWKIKQFFQLDKLWLSASVTFSCLRGGFQILFSMA